MPDTAPGVCRSRDYDHTVPTMRGTLSSYCSLACLAALAAILCLGGVLAAQAPEATPGPASHNPTEPPPAPIPTAAIPEQFTRTAAVLRAVTIHTQLDPDMARLEQRLPGCREGRANAARRYGSLSPHQPFSESAPR